MVQSANRLFGAVVEASEMFRSFPSSGFSEFMLFREEYLRTNSQVNCTVSRMPLLSRGTSQHGNEVELKSVVSQFSDIGFMRYTRVLISSYDLSENRRIDDVTTKNTMHLSFKTNGFQFSVGMYSN